MRAPSICSELGKCANSDFAVRDFADDAQLLCDLYCHMAFQQRVKHHPSIAHYNRTTVKEKRPSGNRILVECISICRQYPSCSSIVYGNLGRILMWNGKDDDAVAAFQHQIAQAHTVVCDGCDRSVSRETGRLICKSCLDVDLCRDCYAKYEVDEVTIDGCQDHAFLESNREVGASDLDGAMPMTGAALAAWFDGLTI